MQHLSPIIPLLPGINYWCRVVNLLFNLTIGPFQKFLYSYVDSQITSVKFLSLLETHCWWQWECYGGQSGLYILLSNVPEHVNDCYCLSKPLLSVLVLFYLFCRVWVPLLHACWFVAVLLLIWSLSLLVGLD